MDKFITRKTPLSTVANWHRSLWVKIRQHFNSLYNAEVESVKICVNSSKNRL